MKEQEKPDLTPSGNNDATDVAGERIETAPARSGGDGKEPTGHTFGDVLDSVLDQPRRLVVLFLLVIGFFGLAVGAVWVVTKMLGLQASEVDIGAENAKVVFESVQKKTGNEDYVVVVNPQGWQNTGIDVSAGDKLTFHAGGKICVDMNSIWENAQLRLKFEGDIVKANKINPDDPTAKPPEDYFSDEQKRQLILERPWTDPDGFNLKAFHPSYQSRHNRYLLPEKPAGGLVGGVTPGAGEPDRAEAFFIGKQDTYVAPQDGQLWFTVNDVQFSDPSNPNLFYNDNVGSFWVRVTVKKKL
jgi:hypothetical protein